jgi:hypothetical protein
MASTTRRFPLALIVVAALSGCAASVNRPSSASAAARISLPAATQQLLVVVVPAQQMSAGSNWTAFLEEWQTSLTAASTTHPLQTALLEREPQVVAERAVLARVTVNDYRYVSQAKRYGLGVMTGNAYMDLDVEYLAPPGKRLLGSRKFSTSSSAWHGVFSALTPKQVEAVVNEIVKEVAEK